MTRGRPIPVRTLRPTAVALLVSHRVRWLFRLVMVLLAGLTTASSFAGAPIDAPRPVSQALQMISSDRMLSDIAALTGPGFNGRQTGTIDDLSSAEFVQRRFLQLLMQSAPGSGDSMKLDRPADRTLIQSTGVQHTTIAPDPILRPLSASDSPPALLGIDYLPILDSPSADIEAPLVFTGYGISDPAEGLDEYSGIDVRNKVVLFLRGKPGGYGKQVSHADKVRIAHARGAIGYLVATGPILSAYETRRGVTGRPSAFYGLVESTEAIPGAWISTPLAAAIFGAHQGTSDRLQASQRQINEAMTPQSAALDTSIIMRWQSLRKNGTLHNVVSIVPGQDATHRHEAVVIGAHRDHFGQQGGLLFAGADDNASGTAVLLEVARALASSPAGRKRAIVLVSFSGEEQGLLGSKLYVSQPLVPLPATVAMINVDHAGVGNGRLTVGVTGLDKTTAQQAGQLAGLEDRLDLFGFFPGGDHVPFKEAGIPTLTVVSSGVHPHFHQPTDRVDTLTPEILVAAARYVLALAWQLADAP